MSPALNMSLQFMTDGPMSESKIEYCSDEDDHNVGFTTKLEDIGKSKLKGLNMVTDYVRDWTTSEAFREAYQNWYVEKRLDDGADTFRRDGILRSFHINLSQFRTEITYQKRVILVKAFQSENDELLGFILFKYNKEGYCIRCLKIANFNAALEYRSLGTGATS